MSYGKMKADPKLTIENTVRISQQMLDSLQILQMDRLTLEKHIAQQLMENPVLEFPTMPAPQKQADGSRKTWKREPVSMFDAYDTLEFFLLNQLNRLHIPNELLVLCRSLVRLIDENGYLPDSHIPDAYRRNREFPAAMRILQALEPAGVGAGDLRECLLLQLHRAQLDDSLAAQLAERYLEDVSRRNYAKLQRLTGATVEQLQEAVQVILSLNPRPGASFASREKTAYVYPDFVLSVQEGKIEILQEARSFPGLTISDYYRKLYETTEDPEVKQYLKERVAGAKRLIVGLENRKTTALRCLEAIVQVQQGFFLNPSRQLVPLTLEKVAQMVDLHTSTVSRAVSGKFLEFEGKVYSLKYFFARGTRDPGQQVSASQIRELIRQIVRNEPPEKPLSDQQIVQILQQGGNRISRRTVAKYREQMGILPSKQRRSL